MDRKLCNICNEEKCLDDFYSQKKQSKSKGEYIYHQPYCKACASKKSYKWIKNNYERFRELDDKYKGTEKGKITIAKYSRKFKDSGYFKDYQSRNLDKFKMYNEKRRSNEKDLKSDFTIDDWKYCLEYFKYSCAYCGKSHDENHNEFGWSLEQEHVIPVTKDGSYTKDNIVPSCRSCNASKRTKDFKTWYREQIFYDINKENDILNYLEEQRINYLIN